MLTEYAQILSEMRNALDEFSKGSEKLNAYDYELKFREITDHYNKLLFQASTGKIPGSKNGKIKVETSFGEITVKKNTQ
jgi:hypothetical protein